MRFAVTILLALVAAPLPAQQVIDRFPVGSRPEPTPLQGVPERSSPITVAKVVGAVGGTLAGGYVAGQTAYVLSGKDPVYGTFAMLIGAAVGAGLGAYIPGESPSRTAPATFALAALGTVAGVGLGLLVPPLAPAGPPAGALVGFYLAY